MNKEILRIALPSIVTNITIPLLGLVDVSIVGHIDGSREVYIGAIAVGGLVFNMIYWVFNFLRMGTSGLTAQAYGREDARGQMAVWIQAMAVSLVCGLFIFLLQDPIEWLAHWVVAPSAEVWDLAIRYFRIRVVAAPAVLMLFSFNGWFVGMQNSTYPMIIAILRNLFNILLSYIFVFHCHWGVEGVAWGTVLSQYLGLFIAMVCWAYKYGHLRHAATLRESLQLQSMGRFFTVNRDIFFRMLFIISVTCGFTSIGARLGDMTLAVNTLLIQLFTLFSYFMDGFALAGEALGGKYIGARNKPRLYQCTRYLFGWGAVVSLTFTLLYYVGGASFLTLLTSDAAVVEASMSYFAWVLLIPLTSFAAFLWDGIFIGATATRPMLYTLVAGAALFFGVYFLCPWFAPDHRLWLAFIIYLATRSAVQSVLAVGVLRKAVIRCAHDERKG